jgi:glutaredoxin 3
MPDAEVIVFSTPTCPACRKAEEFLTQKGIKFRSLDVSADRDALVLLLRFAGQPTVPTIVAYGEVMVGFDAVRLEQMLEGLDARAGALARADAEEREQLRQSEAMVQAALEQAGIAVEDEIERLPEESD